VRRFTGRLRLDTHNFISFIGFSGLQAKWHTLPWVRFQRAVGAMQAGRLRSQLLRFIF